MDTQRKKKIISYCHLRRFTQWISGAREKHAMVCYGTHTGKSFLASVVVTLVLRLSTSKKSPYKAQSRTSSEIISLSRRLNKLNSPYDKGGSINLGIERRLRLFLECLKGRKGESSKAKPSREDGIAMLWRNHCYFVNLLTGNIFVLVISVVVSGLFNNGLQNAYLN